MSTLSTPATESTTKLDIDPWIPAKPTAEDLEWADILTIDLSLYDTKKATLVDTLTTALQRDGFFYVVGHDIPAETVGRTVISRTSSHPDPL
jgi:hypothetical protein